MPDNALRINKMKCILLTAEKLRTQRKIILLDIIFINIHIYKQSSFLAITFSKNDILKELFDILIITLIRCTHIENQYFTIYLISMISIQITDYTLHWRTIELCLSDHIENAINYRCERNNGKIDRSRFLAMS